MAGETLKKLNKMVDKELNILVKSYKTLFLNILKDVEIVEEKTRFLKKQLKEIILNLGLLQEGKEPVSAKEAKKEVKFN